MRTDHIWNLGSSKIDEFYPGDIDQGILPGYNQAMSQSISTEVVWQEPEAMTMKDSLEKPCTAFDGHRCIAAGPLQEVALVVKRAQESGSMSPILIFDDSTGRAFDIDTRGSEAEVVARLLKPPTCVNMRSVTPGQEQAPEAAARGRPRLGVVAREVTLLPRHWDWLNVQPGGASVALRKLVEDARRGNGEKDRRRQAKEAAYHFISALAGNLVGFEEAARALFANDSKRFADLVADWPEDVRSHAERLASCGWDEPCSETEGGL
jgi:hypothetical protein